MSKYQVHQIDRNQRAIMDYLQAHGFSVASIGRPVDLIAGKEGRTYLLEVKQPKGRLRPSQEKFIATWRGHVAVVRDLADAAALVRYHQRIMSAITMWGGPLDPGVPAEKAGPVLDPPP